MWSVLQRFTWSLKNAYIVVRLLDEARVEHKDRKAVKKKERKKNPKERELIHHQKKRQEKWGKRRITARNFYFAGGVRVIQQKKMKMTKEKASYLSRA